MIRNPAVPAGKLPPSRQGLSEYGGNKIYGGPSDRSCRKYGEPRALRGADMRQPLGLGI